MLVDVHDIQMGANTASYDLVMSANIESVLLSLLPNLLVLDLQTQIEVITQIINYLLDFTQAYNSQYITVI
jgi:hypothetical protein